MGASDVLSCAVVCKQEVCQQTHGTANTHGTVNTRKPRHTSERPAGTRSSGVVCPSALRPPSAGVMVVPEGATPPKLRPGLPTDCMRESVCCSDTGGSDAVGCSLDPNLDPGDAPPRCVWFVWFVWCMMMAVDCALMLLQTTNLLHHPASFHHLGVAPGALMMLCGGNECSRCAIACDGCGLFLLGAMLCTPALCEAMLHDTSDYFVVCVCRG